MTVPMPAAASSAVRPSGAPSTSDSGGTDSAEPFASALDGALGSGRSEVDGAGAQAGGDPRPTRRRRRARRARPARPAEPGATPPGGVVAALWALLSGAAKTPPAADASVESTEVPAVGTPVAAGHTKTDGVPPGRAVALARAAGVAHGLHGTQPGKLAEAAPDAATPLPATAAPSTAAPAVAAAQAAAAALAAAGVEGIAVDTTEHDRRRSPRRPRAPTVAAAPATAPTTTVADGEGAPGTAPSSATTDLPVAAPAAAGGNAADTGTGHRHRRGELGAHGGRRHDRPGRCHHLDGPGRPDRGQPPAPPWRSRSAVRSPSRWRCCAAARTAATP